MTFPGNLPNPPKKGDEKIIAGSWGERLCCVIKINSSGEIKMTSLKRNTNIEFLMRNNHLVIIIITTTNYLFNKVLFNSVFFPRRIRVRRVFFFSFFLFFRSLFISRVENFLANKQTPKCCFNEKKRF